MALVATRSAHETWAEMAPVLPPTLTGKAWSLPGLEVHHQELFAAERVPVSVAEGAAPAVGVHFCDAHLPACAAEVPLLHCHHHEVGDAKVTFTRPLPAAATLTVRRGSHAVVTERLAAGATHASVDAQHLLAMRDGIFCAFVQVLGEDGLPPSGVEARLTTAYVRPLPPSAQSEEEKRVICRALYTHYMTASLGAGVQVREAKVEALLGKCMLQWRIIAADVPPSAWPFAHVSSMAEVLDEVAAFMARWPDVPGASYSDSVWFMIDHCTNFEEFSTCAYQVGDTDTLLVPHEGDVLCGVNLFPAVDMDDLVLRVFGGALEWVLDMHQQAAAAETDEQARKRAHRRYPDAVAALATAFGLASGTDLARQLREEVGFFQHVRVALSASPRPISPCSPTSSLPRSSNFPPGTSPLRPCASS